MNQSPEATWFFTREGERIGPVTFAELKAKVEEAALDPRLDLVWCQGMPEWMPAGEIEGLFEKRAPSDAPESLAPAAGPYAPPKSESVADVMSREGEWPGARRRSYLFLTILFPILWNIGFTVASGFLGNQLGPEIMTPIAIVAGAVPMVAAIYITLKRFVNLGMSRWWFLGNFVPFLNFWVGYRCFACPAGYAYHKKLDGPGVALAIIYWLLLALVVLFIIAIFALMFNMVNNPELQDQLREYLRVLQERAPANNP
jgi:uncharacterized membrane protein YhaH (DUF805 family)